MRQHQNKLYVRVPGLQVQLSKHWISKHATRSIYDSLLLVLMQNLWSLCLFCYQKAAISIVGKKLGDEKDIWRKTIFMSDYQFFEGNKKLLCNEL